MRVYSCVLGGPSDVHNFDEPDEPDLVSEEIAGEEDPDPPIAGWCPGPQSPDRRPVWTPATDMAAHPLARDYLMAIKCDHCGIGFQMDSTVYTDGLTTGALPLDSTYCTKCYNPEDKLRRAIAGVRAGAVREDLWRKLRIVGERAQW